MKKIILLALTALMMVGCDESTENIDAPLGGNRFTTVYQTIIVDSCEYISGASRIAHKGNCRFCEERDSIKWEKRKKELEELVIKCKTPLEITHKDGVATDTIVIFKYKEK